MGYVEQHSQNPRSLKLGTGLDPTINAWNNRPLSETEYPFLIVDALVIKIPEGQRVRPRSVLLAIGVKPARVSGNPRTPAWRQ
jgi:transposase-like protein